MTVVSDYPGTPQPEIADVPTTDPTPNAYLEPAAAVANLASRFRLTIETPGYGEMVSASMAVDEEGPYMGVKFDPTQERQWPRTFKYGWPNVIASPSPVLTAVQYPGAWYLDYEGVVPQQIVDWVCLELWRYQNLPYDREISRESVTGASVTFTGPLGHPGGLPARIDTQMDALLSPFILRSGHKDLFTNFSVL